MKLLKCYVFSFGKLKNFEYVFNDNLNTIKEENGWGKSTLASFIKAIFYGLNDSKRNIADNERHKFKPWNSTEKFGGYVEFEWGEKQYKIERFFGNKEAEDTVRLTDVQTGKAFSNTENLGKRIFEIDEEGFLSTTYFSQKDFQVKSNTSITAKFNSVCEVQDSEAFDKAVKSIDEKAKTYKYRGDKGLISDTKREIFTVNEAIEQAILSSKIASDKEKISIDMQKELLLLKVKSENLATKISEAGRLEALSVKKSRYNELKELKNRLDNQKSKHESFFNGHIPDVKEITAYAECNNELTNVIARENIIASDIKTLESLTMSNEKSNRKKLVPSIALFSVSAVIFLIVLILTFVNGFSFLVTLPSIIMLAVTIIFVIVGALMPRIYKPAPKDQSQIAILEQKRNELNEYSKIKIRYETEIDGFINKFNFDSFNDKNSALNIIFRCLDDYKNCLSQIAEVDKQIENFSTEKTLFENLNEGVVEDVNVLRTQLSDVQNEYAVKTNELAAINSAIRRHRELGDSLPELESKKAELVLKLEQYKEDYDTLEKTKEYLILADENLKTKYRAPLQDSLNKYLSYIVGEQKQAKIDINMTVTVEENGSDKVTDYYSKGYQNLFEICKRFALIDVLFTGEKPFIILDDPFYNLDDDKLSSAISLIKRLSEEYQIIYFVCHESRRA